MNYSYSSFLCILVCRRFWAQLVITLGFYFFSVMCRECWIGGVYTHKHPHHPSDVYFNIGGQYECNYSRGDWLGGQLCLISGCFEPLVCWGEIVKLQSCKSLHNQNVARLSEKQRAVPARSQTEDLSHVKWAWWPLHYRNWLLTIWLWDWHPQKSSTGDPRTDRQSGSALFMPGGPLWYNVPLEKAGRRAVLTEDRTTHTRAHLYQVIFCINPASGMSYFCYLLIGWQLGPYAERLVHTHQFFFLWIS